MSRKDLAGLLPFFIIGIPMGLFTVWLERYHVGALGEAWNLSVEADSLNMEAYNNFGTALLALGKTPEAILQFRKALEIKPDYAKAKDNLDRALRG